MACSFALLSLLLALFYFNALTTAQNISSDQLNLVVEKLAQGATHSWEIGTRTQALIELDTPSFSVLTKSQSLPPSSSAPSSLSTVLEIAAQIVAGRNASNNGTQGPQPLINDGAAGDPASIGVAVLIANWTGQGNSTLDYAGAAKDQLDYLLEKVPRTSDGAISHRVSEVQLWSDFVYMVPPFLAYYGVLSANKTLVQEAYNQIKLYRSYLRDGYNVPKNSALWRHIVMGSAIAPDSGHWSTGNAWAAAGMLRVLGTIVNSQYAEPLKSERKDLASWIDEIHNGMYAHVQPSGLFLNYADSNTSSFEDASSTALLAATVYRQSIISGTHTHLPAAELARKALSSANDTSSSASVSSSNLTNMKYFTSSGWLVPTVNPLQFGVELAESTVISGKSGGSPEGQAFVVEMQAAWQDWVSAGSVGANAGRRTMSSPSSVCAFVFALVIALALLD